MGRVVSKNKGVENRNKRWRTIGRRRKGKYKI